MKKTDTTVIELANNNGLEFVKGDIFKRGDKFYKLANLATDNGKTRLGYAAVQVPNPDQESADQVADLVDIYGDDVIVSAVIKSVVISKQAADRKRALGNDKKMPESFKRDYFNTEYVSYLKNGGSPLTMEQIDEQAQAAYDEKNPTGETDSTTIWF